MGTSFDVGFADADSRGIIPRFLDDLFQSTREAARAAAAASSPSAQHTHTFA